MAKKKKRKKESQRKNDNKLQRNRSNPVNLPKKNHVNNAIYLRPSVFHVAVVGDLFLLLAGGGEEVVVEVECEDSTSSEQHRFTAAMVVLATLVWTLPVTSCRISL